MILSQSRASQSNLRHARRGRPFNVLLVAPLPIDLRRFAAKHADVALSANLVSKNFALIAVVTLLDAKETRAK
jgi:hypothetical protein